MKKILSVMFSALFILQAIPSVYAMSANIDDTIYSSEYYDELKKEIQAIVQEAEGLTGEDFLLYTEENAERIEEVDIKFSEYVEYCMNQFLDVELESATNTRSAMLSIENSEEYLIAKNNLILDLLGKEVSDEINMYSDEEEPAITPFVNKPYEYLAQYHSTYFEWSSYGKRNGYMTYSMVPKTDVRLFKTSAETAWLVLRGSWSYSMTKNLNGLKDQFMCHFHAKIEHEWNIEVERPDVGLAKTIAAFCNP